MSYPIPHVSAPAAPLCASFCCGCCKDIGDGLAEYAEEKRVGSSELKTDAFCKVIRAPLACGNGGGNVAILPDILSIAAQITTVVHFSINTTPLNIIARIATFVAFPFFIINAIKGCIDIRRLLSFRNELDFSKGDAQGLKDNLIKLKENYFTLTPDEEKRIASPLLDAAEKKSLELGLHQKNYRLFENRVGHHIAKAVFGDGDKTFSDTKINRLIEELNQPVHSDEAHTLILNINIQTKKALILQFLGLATMILTLIGLCLTFATCAPTAIVVIMNTATALSIVEGILYLCWLDTFGWDLKMPDFITSTSAKIKSCASSCFAYLQNLNPREDPLRDLNFDAVPLLN